MSVRAIVVGIEKYDESGEWDVPSPCANAVAVAEWLAGHGVDPAEIFLFLAPAEGDRIAALRGLGVKVHEADSRAIDDVLTGDLIHECKSGSRLFLYWSGHAVTDNRGQRILFCKDYNRRARDDRVVNANRLFRRINTLTYQCFDELIAMLDVCGTRHQTADAPVSPNNSDPGLQQYTPLNVYYAAPEGEYARADTGEGAFTYCLLRALRQFGRYPEWGELKPQLDAELVRSELPAFSVTIGPDGDDTRYFGKMGREKLAAAASVIELLRSLAVSKPVLRLHYSVTASTIGNLKMRGAQGLTDMARDLASLADDAGPVSHGLIQFLLRLSEEQELSEAIETWIRKNVKNKSALKTERERLEGEKSRKYLIVRLNIDEQGRFVSWHPFLRNLDFSLVRDRSFEPVPFAAWDDFAAGLVDLLKKLKADELTSDLEIHFLVESPIYDRPLHLLPGPTPGSTLGKEYIVVVHDLDRVCTRMSTKKALWREKAAALYACAPADVEVLKLEATGRWRAGDGFWFAGFPLPDGATAHEVKSRLRDLLNTGAPAVYWSHRTCDMSIQEELKTILGGLNSIKKLPEAFYLERLGENELTVAGSLLLDDPSFDPFTSSKGVQLT